MNPSLIHQNQVNLVKVFLAQMKKDLLVDYLVI